MHAQRAIFLAVQEDGELKEFTRRKIPADGRGRVTVIPMTPSHTAAIAVYQEHPNYELEPHVKKGK